MKLFSSLLTLSFLMVPLAYGMSDSKPLLKDIDQEFLNYLNEIRPTCHGSEQCIIACIENLISHNNDNINAQDNGGSTRLHYAVLWFNTKIIQLLLDAGANTTIKNMNNQTPVLFLSNTLGDDITDLPEDKIKKSRQIITLLISHTTNLNEQDSNGETLLSYALKRSSIQSTYEVEQLIAAGATVPVALVDHPLVIKAQRRQALLLQAIQRNDSNTIAALLKQDAYENQSVTNFIHQQLFQIIEQDNVEALRAFILKGFTLFSLDKAGNNALHKAVQYKSVKVIRYLSTLLHKVGKLDTFLLRKNKADSLQ